LENIGRWRPDQKRPQTALIGYNKDVGWNTQMEWQWTGKNE